MLVFRLLGRVWILSLPAPSGDGFGEITEWFGWEGSSWEQVKAEGLAQQGPVGLGNGAVWRAVGTQLAGAGDSWPEMESQNWGRNQLQPPQATPCGFPGRNASGSLRLMLIGIVIIKWR